MTAYPSIRAALVLLGSLLATTACNAKAGTAAPLPAPVLDAPRAATSGQQTAVVAGGCFWGIQAVFQHVKGVISATSGYSGGSAKTAEYEIVSTGEAGHAESVWGYALAWFLVNDRVKLIAYRIFDPTKAPLLAKKMPDLTPQIATRAYELYQQRGRQDGLANEDWFEAERETRKEQVGHE